MKRLFSMFGIAVVVALALSIAPGPAAGASGCGIKPIKPITPIGCKDLVARCQCDSKGQNCKWVWDCVTR